MRLTFVHPSQRRARDLRTTQVVQRQSLRFRYTDDQMVKILREADNAPVAQVAKKHGVSEATIYAWRKKYGELEVNDVRHLKQLERENARLKKLLAERDLEIEVMKEVNRKKW